MRWPWRAEKTAAEGQVAGESRWRGRPVLARLLSTAIFLAPLAVSVAVASLVATSIPHPVGVTRTILWWFAVLGSSTVALYGTERAARRFLPLAALLKMTMLFPDKAPSRLGVALRSGTTKDLERRLDVGLLAAEQPTEAAAEILALAGALSAHDKQTRGHSERVRAITDMIAEELELSPGARDRLRWSALLHDIGKLTVHTEVLNKTDRLSDSDWEALRSHPLEGARLIAPLSSWLGEWSLTVAQHHEKHDGTGYPYGLAGEDMEHAIKYALNSLIVDDITMFLGPARDGVLLEVGVVGYDDDEPAVIHAMKLRPKFYPYL